MNLEGIIRETKTYYCLECGKCSSLCPISRYNPAYSPRVMVENALLGFEDELIYNRELFSCLTCYTCQQRCPSDVDYPMFIQKMRVIAQNKEQHGICAHSGQLHSLARLMANPNIKQKRLEWLSPGCRTSLESDILFWVGCAPYFEPLFEDIGFRATDITLASLKILNFCGIEPKLLPDEKCCGHDLIWTGDVETFNKLAEYNAVSIKKAEVKKIIFSCPECYRTLKLDYPNYGFNLNCELQHISEFLAEKIEKDGLKFKEIKRKVTYQDPCRLGRHLGIYHAPRKVLKFIPGIEFIEMRHSGEDSTCCGTSAFTNCSLYSKQIRAERLNEAMSSRAETLITSCPKCQMHFRCTMVNKGEEKWPGVEIEVMDLVNLVASALDKE